MQPLIDVKKSQQSCPVESLFGGSTDPKYKKEGPNGLPWTGNNFVIWKRRCIKPLKETESLESEQIRDVHQEPKNVDDLISSFQVKGWDYKEPPLTFTRLPNTTIDTIKSGENRKAAAEQLGWDSLIFDEVVFKDRSSKRIAAVQFNNTNPSVKNNIETMAKNLHAAERDHELGQNPTNSEKRNYVRLLYGTGDEINTNVPESTITKVINRAKNFGIHGVLNRKYNNPALNKLCDENGIYYGGDRDAEGRFSFVIKEDGMRLFCNQLMKMVNDSQANMVLSDDEKGKNIKFAIHGCIDKPDQNISNMKKKREAWFKILDAEVLSHLDNFILNITGKKHDPFDIKMRGFIAQNGGANSKQQVIEPVGTLVFEEYMKPICENLNLKF
tara:strand:- start:2500 stop:3654 length:1155 start_codon:yes stop_codon:yes gene_type:complete